MTSSNKSVHILIARYVTGELTEEEADRLVKLLQDDTELQNLFLENVRLDWALSKRYENLNAWKQVSQDDDVSVNWNENDRAMLHDWEKNTATATDSSAPLCHDDTPSHPSLKKSEVLESTSPRVLTACDKPIHKTTQPFGSFFWTCLSLFILLIGYTEYQYCFKQGNNIAYLAQIKEMVDPVWEGHKTYKRGQFIEADQIQLKSGSVLLEFMNGTQMVLQGPGRVVVVNSKCVYCDLGKVFASVPPPATGFELSTPFGGVFDLGTEFFADVTPENTTVGVVRGKVELRASTKQPVLLATNTAIQIDRNKNTVPKDFSQLKIVDGPAFTAALEQYVSRENEKKKQADTLLDTHPNLLARFDFSQWTGGAIPNCSQRGKNNLEQAEVIGCRIGQGSLADRKSICFTAHEDRAEISLDDSCQSLTLTAMVRVDQLDHAGNVLLESKDFFDRKGSFLWQLTGEGYLQFHLYCGTARSSVCSNSRICISRNDLETWIKISLVADARKKTISHYVDDRLISTTPWPDPIPIVPGDLTVGNGQTKTRYSTKNDRFFAGALSELAVYDSAVTPIVSEK